MRNEDMELLEELEAVRELEKHGFKCVLKEKSIICLELERIFVELFGEPTSVVEVRDLIDVGNEQLFHFKYDIEQETFDDSFYVLRKKLLIEQLDEIFTGDHAVTLEAAFRTNNHFFFVITALK